MSFTAKYAVGLLLPVLLMGCDQKVKQTPPQALAPPIVDAPPQQPVAVSTADLPAPVVGDVPPAPSTTANSTPPPPPPKKKVPRPKKPVTPATNSGANPAANQEAANPGAAVSAIGQLSGGDSGDLRAQTENSISGTEKGLNGISRTLSDSETKTAAQIREFLKQAREALKTGDVDGAHTLALKARVLLTELNQ
ncbi:flagellar protein FliS [Acidicapsa ligni]|uniref:flagellar protein FliS n=1 Tax=Acidicapsa ligni TaxID=542300 RepID=UPI0021DFB357|nr:flagellar protein FliS [Acidicapsa ligni]